MTGATSPRLQLELICARILLPAASGEGGYAARLDRIERRLDVGAGPSVGMPSAPHPAPGPALPPPVAPAVAQAAAPTVAPTAPVAPTTATR